MRGVSLVIIAVGVAGVILIAGGYFLLNHWGVLTDPAQQQDCLLALDDAFNTGSAESCSSISCLPIRKYCIGVVGGKSSSCAEITDGLLAAKCERSIALARNDESFCEQIPIGGNSYLERITCEAQVEKNPDHCQDGPLPQRCRYSVAIYLHSGQVCNSLADAGLKDRCTHFLSNGTG